MIGEAVKKPKKIRLGDLLIEQKIISQEQLTTALAEQKKSGRKLGRVLIENGYISEEQLLNFLSRQLALPYVDLKRFQFKPEIVRLIPEAHARRFRVIALHEGKDGVLIGMADPTDIFAYDEIARLLGRPLRIAIIREADLLRAIDLVYRRTQEITGLAHELEQELSAYDVDLGALASSEALADAPVVKLLQSMFEDATQINASDIHIEPGETELRIRFRIDGVLRVQMTADRRIASALVSRLKLMAGLDIAEKRLPQDGRCNVHMRDKNIDVRMSTMPTQYGESVVLRLLNATSGVLEMDSLGMTPDTLARFRELIHAPHGMVLVTGPTGSGKTTTLYSALKAINNPAFKILTVEDPVEYRLPGINQVQVNPKIDLSFSRVLRSFLRQDPDIILVGEMRDQETAEIGLRAAMTGHLVLSSLHTNDALSAPARLMDMGAEAYLVAASLRGVLSQRLMRKVCEACAEPVVLAEAVKGVVRHELGDNADFSGFRRGRGCSFCNNTGYQGRIGVYELVDIDDTLVRLLQHGKVHEFSDAARHQKGFVSLRRQAVQLAAHGVSTMQQVLRASYGVED